MKRVALSAVAVTAIMGSISTMSASGVNILSDVKWDAQIRPRYEFVDDGTTGTNAHDNAQAFTARTKLKATGNLLEIPGLTASIGVISVDDFGGNKFNSTINGQTNYAKVADPQIGMISNAEINYKTCNTLYHAGRGQVNLDNQRFIGTVGWRQLERSYDSIFIANNSIPNLSLLAAWVYGFRGVAGGQAQVTQDTNTVLLHAAYDVNPNLKVTAYDYMIAAAHDTYGIALTGKVNVGNTVKYRLEYAKQKDASMDIHNLNDTNGTGGPGTIGQADADYYNIDLSTTINGVILGANYEFLSGTDGNDGKTAFSTPLATAHKFNGWADKFLATPTGGLKDANIRLGYKAPGFGKFLVVYHEFAADKEMSTPTSGVMSDDLGKEVDAIYVNKIPGYNNLNGMIKYANYSGGDVKNYTNDVKKLWVMLDYKISSK